MLLLQAIILGLTQGLTEFIPVSSSGHLILVGQWLNFPYSGLAFDTALDIGTLIALYVFFRKDFTDMAGAFFRNEPGPTRRLAWQIVIATIPAVILGLTFEDFIARVFHDGPNATLFVGINLIWVAGLMMLADRLGENRRQIEETTKGDAIRIGLAQALALIPGVSRSGITISAGRALNFDRVAATRFSFLLSAPIITAATMKQVLKPETMSHMASVPAVYFVAILAAFASGYWAIKFLIGYLGKHGLAVFAGYRVVVGVIVIATAIIK